MNKESLCKIIVTGGAGYIGSHVVYDLLQRDTFVHVLDDNSYSTSLNLENIQNTRYNAHLLNIYYGDCSHIETFDPRGIDGVIHFAAYKSVGESVREPLKYYRNNINSLLNVLDYIQRYKIRNLIFSSSCTVYGEPDSVPVTENTPIKNSPSPYGQSKIMCERILEDFYKENPWVNIISLRYFNPIGAYSFVPIGENIHGLSDNLMVRLNRWVLGLDDFKIYGNTYDTPDGSAIRDYIDVGDLSRCHIDCLQSLTNKDGGYNYYNVGTGTGTSVLSLVNKYLEVNNISNKVIQFGPKRKGDINKIFADPSKIEKDIGFRCVVPLEHSLKTSYEYSKYLLRH